jgi:hypothetical protein
MGRRLFSIILDDVKVGLCAVPKSVPQRVDVFEYVPGVVVPSRASGAEFLSIAYMVFQTGALKAAPTAKPFHLYDGERWIRDCAIRKYDYQHTDPESDGLTVIEGVEVVHLPEGSSI